jgi:hypothetical protein
MSTPPNDASDPNASAVASGVFSGPPTNHAELAYRTLLAKQPKLTERWEYYRGEQLEKYLSNKMRKACAQSKIKISENMCGIVADSVSQRIRLLGFGISGDNGADDTKTKALNDLIEQIELETEAIDVHEGAVVMGESYLIAWKEDDEIQVDFQDARNCHIFPDPDKPKKPLFAAKWFVDLEDYRVIVLYYTDRVEYWRSTSTEKAAKGQNRTFIKDTEEGGPNEFKQIPVFQFRRRRPDVGRITPTPEMDTAIPIQDEINGAATEQYYAEKYYGAPLRYAVTSNEGVDTLKTKPGEIARFQSASAGSFEPTQIGQYAQADIMQLQNVITAKIQTLATATGTPQHLFFQAGGVPSGDALVALEAPLNTKVLDWTDRLTSQWVSAIHFLTILNGDKIDKSKIEVFWDDPATTQPKALAEIREIAVRTGIPLEVLLKREGWSTEEIKEVIDAASPATDVPPAQAQAQNAAASTAAAVDLAPIVAETVELIGDAALGALIQDGRLTRAIAAAAPAVPAESEG